MGRVGLGENAADMVQRHRVVVAVASEDGAEDVVRVAGEAEARPVEDIDWTAQELRAVPARSAARLDGELQGLLGGRWAR